MGIGLFDWIFMSQNLQFIRAKYLREVNSGILVWDFLYFFADVPFFVIGRFFSRNPYLAVKEDLRIHV